MPERTAVFTVRLAPSLIAGLRERAGSRGQTLSATVGGGGAARISITPTSDTVARRVEIEFVGDRLASARLAQAYAIVVPERRRVTGNERRDDERQRSRRRTGGRAGWRRSTRGCPPSASARTRRSQSQTVGLRELAAERGLLVTEDLVFEDEGFSGATLTAPGARAAARPRGGGSVRGAALPRAGSARAPLRLPGAAARGARARRAWRCASRRSPSGAARRRTSCCASSRG